MSWPRPPTTAAGWWCAASTCHAQEGQEELFAYWRHFAFLTNRAGDMHAVDAAHRDHAEVELCIRDLKDQALRHFPSGSFAANAGWTVIACLAHNMVRWVGQLGLEDETWRAARIILTQPSRRDTPDGCQRRARRRPLSVSGGV